MTSNKKLQEHYNKRSVKIRAFLEDERHVVIEYNGPVDREGKRPFTLYWLTTYIPGLRFDDTELKMKMQCFRANVGVHISRMQEQGRLIHIIEEGAIL